jgi:diaminohydroxyphosphoribosylaminopyrimidine deaminase / 5-amino-6-(5-phosphoribosylamino)uracil reductase
MTAKTPQITVAEATALERAFELAQRGPITGVNPRVGCVLLDSTGAFVAEGWHEGSGTPHAEVMALNAARTARVDTRGLTAVVTLEPCSHTGKTGPCVSALIDAGISKVVYSVSDPGVESRGGGDTLRGADIEVIHGVEEARGRKIIERWYHSVSTGRPWVTAKWAMSWDGRAAAADGTSQWITGVETREAVHLDRSQHDAIIVGTTTALVDNPSLTARTSSGELYPHQPRAIVVGQRDVPADAAVRTHPGGFHHHRNHDLGALMASLFAEGIRSLYVEGGPTLASAFLQAGLVDDIHITIGPVLLGGPHTAVGDIGVSSMSEAIHLDIHEINRVGDDVVVTARPRREDR